MPQPRGNYMLNIMKIHLSLIKIIFSIMIIIQQDHVIQMKRWLRWILLEMLKLSQEIVTHGIVQVLLLNFDNQVELVIKLDWLVQIFSWNVHRHQDRIHKFMGWKINYKDYENKSKKRFRQFDEKKLLNIIFLSCLITFFLSQLFY